jgi:hypothetical protein
MSGSTVIAYTQKSFTERHPVPQLNSSVYPNDQEASSTDIISLNPQNLW